MLCAQAVVPKMKAAGYGRIVNVTSVTGPVMAMHDNVVYATAKAGMVGLTRATALDAAPHGVTVNAVGPGWIEGVLPSRKAPTDGRESSP